VRKRRELITDGWVLYLLLFLLLLFLVVVLFPFPAVLTKHRFFAQVLKMTPDNIDDVLVEADGKYCSSSLAKAKVAAAPYDYMDNDSD
jgi:hypothetical protein